MPIHTTTLGGYTLFIYTYIYIYIYKKSIEIITALRLLDFWLALYVAIIDTKRVPKTAHRYEKMRKPQ